WPWLASKLRGSWPYTWMSADFPAAPLSVEATESAVVTDRRRRDSRISNPCNRRTRLEDRRGAPRRRVVLLMPDPSVLGEGTQRRIVSLDGFVSHVPATAGFRP